MSYLNIHSRSSSIEFVIEHTEHIQHLYDLLPFEVPTLEQLVNDHMRVKHHTHVVDEQWQDLLIVEPGHILLLLDWKRIDDLSSLDLEILPRSLRLILPSSEFVLIEQVAHLVATHRLEAQGYIYDNEGETPFTVVPPYPLAS